MAETVMADDAVLVDREMLGALRAALGGGVDMLVAKAGGVIEDRVAKLAAADPVADPEAAARLAHEIGGVGGQIGLKLLAQLALAFEHRLRGGDATGAAEAVGAIADAARRSLADLRAA